jgi:glycosyltransferase involved in cell wall biosynthesis
LNNALATRQVEIEANTVATRAVRLAIISTHPVQYYAPVFRSIAASGTVQPRVFYTWSQAEEGTIFDPGFGVELKWDIPLLDGYEYEFVPNVAQHPGTGRFTGLRNPTLVQAIEQWRPDAILVYGWNYFSHLQAMRHFKGRIPVYYRSDSTLIDRQSPFRTWARRTALRQIFRYADTAIAVGTNNADYFEWCGIPRKRIAHAPHSIDVHRFADTTGSYEDEAHKRRAELGIGPGERAFLYAGKLIAKKDPLSLLQAFLDHCPTGHLIYVGNGELEAELKRRAAGQSRVHFLPFQNQASMPWVYRLGEIFVLPSVGPAETWGLAINEAMTCGRPAIASSRVGGARDLIVAGRNGWTFEAGNLESLGHVLRTSMATDDYALRSMGRRGQEMAQSWSSETTAERICEVVRRR